MKNFLALFALLSPFTAMAAVCDTTELEKIEQRYIGTAPDCIASGNYSSMACGGVRQAREDSTLEIAQLKESGCDHSAYHQDPRVKQNNKLVDALPNKQEIKTKEISQKKPSVIYPKGTVGYAQDVSERICTNLIPDITRNYNITKLELVSHDLFTDTLVSCTYRAVALGIYGDSPTMVTATLNTTNGRFNIR